MNKLKRFRQLLDKNLSLADCSVIMTEEGYEGVSSNRLCEIRRDNGWKIQKKKNILVYDIETSPIIGYAWKTWNTNILKVLNDWHIICFAYKWLGEDKTYFVSNWKNVTDDKPLTDKLHSLFEEADIVIAHNGDKFDQKKCHAKFLEHGLTPPSPYKQIDTLKVARRNFRLTSNRLDSIGDLLGVGRKVSHEGFISMYDKLLDKCKDTQKKMEDYNIQDVDLLEKVYYKLRPWIKNHPDVSTGLDACPKCGSFSIVQKGYRHTKHNYYKRYKCKDCGGWCSERKSEKRETNNITN